jgi:ribosomal protein L13
MQALVHSMAVARRGSRRGLLQRSLWIARRPRDHRKKNRQTSSIEGMLPRGPLGREMFKKLKVYVGADHPHTAQQPQTLDL